MFNHENMTRYHFNIFHIYRKRIKVSQTISNMSGFESLLVYTETY